MLCADELCTDELASLLVAILGKGLVLRVDGLRTERLVSLVVEPRTSLADVTKTSERDEEAMLLDGAGELLDGSRILLEESSALLDNVAIVVIISPL